MKQSLSGRLLFLFIAMSAMAPPARAIIATWNANPANGDWNLASNWSSMAPPNGPADIATFGLSSITSVFLSANTEVDSVIFNAGASAYTITARPMRTLTVSGAGIMNNSGITQNFVADGGGTSDSFVAIRFTDNAALGDSISLLSNGSAVAATFGALIEFRDASSAGTATLTAIGGLVSSGRGGRIRFYDNSSAGTLRLL